MKYGNGVYMCQRNAAFALTCMLNAYVNELRGWRRVHFENEMNSRGSFNVRFLECGIQAWKTYHHRKFVLATGAHFPAM